MSGINWYATLDNKEFLAKLQQCADRVKGTSSTIKKEGTAIDSVFKKLAQAAASFGAALSVKELISSLVKVRGEFQSLETAFRVMLGNAEQANALMAQLTKTAATTPFSLTDVTSAAKQLLAYGVAADSVNETLIKLGDISAGLAIPLGDLTYLYGTTMAQGRLYTQDLNQFTNRGIPMIGELAKQFGVATGEVKKLVEEGRVGFPQVEAAINSLTGEGSKFGGLMAEQVKGINGLISNLGDAVDRMFDAIGKSNQDAIEGVLKGAINIVDNYEKVGRVLAEIVAVWGTYKAACVAAHLAMYKHTALLRTLLTVFPKLAAAQKALNAAMLSNPYVLAATALSALIVAMVNATDATKGLEKAQEEYQARVERLEEKEEEHRRSVEKLIGVAEDERLSTEERLSALEKLEGWYPTIFGKYQTEYDMLSNILTIKRQIAAQDAANSISEPKNRLKMVEDTIAKLEKKSQDYIARMKEELGDAYTGTSPWASDGLSTAERAQLEMLKNTRAELKTEVSKAEAEAYFSNLAGISNEQLAAMIKERETLLAKIAIGETSDAKRHVGRTTTGYKGVYTADELQGQLNRLEAEQSRRNEPLTTNTERLARAQRAYLEAQQAYTDFLSDSSTQMTDVDAAKRAEELKSKVKAAKAELEKWGGAIEKTTAVTEAGELSVAVSVDTKEAQEALVEYQAALKALEDYRASTRVTVEADTEKASAALSNLSKEGDEAIKAEIAQYNERLEGNEAYQRRKLAIAEKYAGLITKAETPEQKTELEQQRTAAMQAARAEATEADSVLRGSFDAIVSNIKEQLSALFGAFEPYEITTGDGASEDRQKALTLAVASIRDAAEDGLNGVFDVTLLREQLTAAEDALKDISIEPFVGADGVVLDTESVIDGIRAIDTELAMLSGDAASVSVELKDSATGGIESIENKLNELDGNIAVSTAALTDSATEGIEAVEGRLNELDGSTATSATMLTDSAANGVETVESRLNELGGTTVVVQATLDDNTAKGINAVEHSLNELDGSAATSTATLTDGATEGIETVEGKLDELSGATATVQATLDDSTVNGINAVEHSLNELNGSTATSTATLTDNATKGIEAVNKAIDELSDKRASVHVAAIADTKEADAVLSDVAGNGDETVLAEIALYNERLNESEAYQRRKLAIAEKYAELIAKAETPEQKAEVEQQRTTAMQAARAEAAETSSVLKGSFETVANSIREQLSGLFRELSQYTASATSDADVSEWQDVFNKAVTSIQETAEDGLKSAVDLTPLREQLTAVESVLSDTSIEPIVDAEGVTLNTSDAIDGIKAIKAELAVLAGDTADVSVALVDAATEGISSVERRVDELDGRAAAATTTLTGNASEGIVTIKTKLDELDGSVATSTVSMTDATAEGINAVEGKLDSLGDTTVSVRATLDSSAIDETNAFKVEAQVEGSVEGVEEIKDAYNELKDTVGEDVAVGQVNADGELKRFEDVVAAAKAKYESLTSVTGAGELPVTVSVDTKEAQDALSEYQMALKALEGYRASTRVTAEADTENAGNALSNLSKEGDEAIQVEIAQYNERLEGNEAYQRRKLAITEKYAGIIAKAESSEQKTELEQQRTAEMQAARAEASETDSVLRGSFDAIMANIREQLGTLLGELTSYTAKVEEGAPLSDWQKSFNDAVAFVQETAEGGLRNVLDIAPLREYLEDVETVLGDASIEPLVGEGGVTIDTSDAVNRIRAVEAELAVLAGDAIDVSVNVDGVEEIKDAYNELRGTVGEGIAVGRVDTDGELKRLEDAVAAAKAKYESLVTVTEAGEDALSDLRARNRQKEIELIENSFEQRLATIKSEYDAELSELDKQQAALEDVNGGILTQGMVDELEKARSLADDIRKKALEDAINDEMASFNARVDESETYQRRRLAIAERYAALIAAAEEPEQKTELEQRKTTELKAARVNEAIADIDWQSVFGKTSRLFEDQIRATLEQLREYTASDEYKALQPSERKTVTEAIDRLETMTVSGQGTLSFRDLREQADSVGQAFSDVVTARNEEAAAYDELLAAQQEYAAALETGDQSRIEPAQTKVEETKTAADASTARYLSAKDNLNELSQSYGDALSDTRDGLEALASGLRQLSGSSLSSVYNGLQTFVDGLNKLQVGDGEGILSKMLSKMTSLPIGEIISIADIFSEGISPILTNIVDTLFSSVTNILDDILSLDIFKDLFSSIGNGLASLGDTLTFGLFSGLRNSNAKEVRELTETLTESNEQLTNSIDKLCEEIESEGGVTAVETAEQAIENMEQVIEQTMDILEANMGYHNHHHSNSYYWGLTEEDYASLNETLADYALKYGEGAEASVVNSLEDIYGLTPEEMDYIRTWNTTMWNEMLEQGKYDMSEYWEAYADLAGEIEEIENSLKETLTQTTFDTLRDNFLDALTDMETEAEDFSEDFEDMLRTAVVNSMLSELFDDEIQAFYDSFAELFENGTDAITESDLEALNDQWDTLVDEMLEMRDYYFEALGLTDDSTSEAAQASSALTVEASQESVDEANGRLTAMTALQSQTLTQLQSMQEASTTLSNKQYTLTAEIRQALVTANGHLEDIYERLKVKGNEIVAGLEDIHNALT